MSNDPGAQFELAMRLVQAGRTQEALACMTQAADAGLMLAEAQLGIWQLLGAVATQNAPEGLRRIQRAAKAGDDIACLLLAGLHAMGTLAAQDWKASAHWLGEAARRGNHRAQTLLSLLRAESETSGAPEATLDLEGLAAAPIPGSQTLRDQPRIFAAKNFLPTSWCNYIRALADPALAPADVHNAAQGRSVQPVRTSAHMSFGAVDTDPLLAIVSHRIARWTNTPVENGERTAVLRYRPGQQYRQHVDFFDPKIPSIWAEAERGGQRVLTVLIWLNSDFQGGETDFPLISLRQRGNIGDALAFWNVLPDESPDLATSHAGLPVTSGEKWLISKWIRSRPQEHS